MPIYEYSCADCAARFEKLLFRTQETVHCPACGGGEVQRRLSTFSVPKGSVGFDFGAQAEACPPGGGCGAGPCGGGACSLN